MYAKWRQYVGDPLMPKDWPRRLRLGLNGFGQLARTMLRCSLEDNRGLDVVAINEPSLTPEQMIYLIKYDTVLGPFKGYLSEHVHVTRATEENPGEFCSLEIAGRLIAVFRFQKADEIPWNWLNVEYVLETTGDYRHLYEATKHLIGGRARKVLVVGDAVDIPLLMYPVSCREYQRGTSVVASGSPMSHAIATLVSLVDASYSHVECMVTLVLPVDRRQNTVDGPSKDPSSWRRGRGATQSIIPGRCPTVVHSVIQALPRMQSRLECITMHVPVFEGAVVDLTFRTTDPINGVSEVIERLMKSPLLEAYNQLHTRTQPIVNRDPCESQKEILMVQNPSPSSFVEPVRHDSEHSVSISSGPGQGNRTDLTPQIRLPKDLVSIMLPLGKEDLYVSTDCTGKGTMCLLNVDFCLGLPSGNTVKLVSWFDTGVSYCKRILDTLVYMRGVDNN